MSLTKILVGLFIVLLLAASFSARGDSTSDIHDGARISLGYTLFNSSSTVGEFGYEMNGWEGAVTLIGEGDTKNGYVDGTTEIASLSYLIRPEWEFLWGKNYYRLGGSYVHDSPLVGPTNFRLGIGMDYDVFALEFVHYSSAGIHNPNTGLDAIQLRYQIP